jgi:hypothetical protein
MLIDGFVRTLDQLSCHPDTAPGKTSAHSSSTALSLVSMPRADWVSTKRRTLTITLELQAPALCAVVSRLPLPWKNLRNTLA